MAREVLISETLKEALHGLYVGLFQAHKKSPEVFHFGRLTTIMTGIMGLENLGWRVVGIAPEALMKFSEQDFERFKDVLPRSYHRQSRNGSFSIR